MVIVPRSAREDSNKYASSGQAVSSVVVQRPGSLFPTSGSAQLNQSGYGGTVVGDMRALPPGHSEEDSDDDLVIEAAAAGAEGSAST